ncbi:Vitellogenin 2 [Caligus rogercresseyi]|uniref:Vitellogenin 2 n=1 Tax=Caligus rogercresseyi TaxID=217165 RepID=A0A7T8KGU7_CALRO|nr:Vitellogenin 2 [Caligus rogercresseyi]
MKTILMEKAQITTGLAAVARFEAKFNGGERPRAFTYQVAFGKGMDASNKTHWHLTLESEPTSPAMGHKICVNGHTTAPHVPFWDIGMMRNSNLNLLIQNVIGFGKTCKESQVKTYITSRVSEKQLRWSKESPVAKKCQEYMDKRIPGASTTYECTQTRYLAKMYDEVDVKNGAVKLTSSLQSLWWPYVTENHSFTHVTGHFQPKRESSAHIVFHKASETVSLTLKTPERHIKFGHIRVPYTLRTMLPLVAGESNIVKSLNLNTGERFNPVCHVEKDWLRTFDNRSLPLHMDDCFHLVAGDCSSTVRFGLLARSVPHTIGKEIKAFVGKTEVIMTPSSTYSRGNRNIKITIDGTPLVVPKGMIKTFPVGSEFPLIKIYRSIDDVYGFEAPSHSLYFRTNGERISLSPSMTMKGKLCGICGDMNGQTLGDISGPSRCIYSSPLAEVAAYRVSSPTCSPLETGIKQKLEAETAQCARFEEIPTEVIKTYTSLVGKCTSQKHMILERGGETCFSTTPVTQCGAQCSPKPKQLISKKFGFTCMKSGRVTELYREKVIQGLVLPELKSLPVTFSTAVLVPQSCSSIVSGHPSSP